MEPLTDNERPQAALRAVSFAAERLLAAESWRDCIGEVLRNLGEAAGASRVYMYENHISPHGGLLMSLRHEWSAPGIVPSMSYAENQAFPYEPGFGRWRSALSEGRTIQGLLRNLPPEEVALMDSPHILSMALVPIFSGQLWWGFMGVDDCAAEREWSPAEVEALRTAAGTLGAAIRREQTAERLREAEARYRTLVEQVPVVIYIDSADAFSTSVYLSPQIEQLIGTKPDDHYADPNLWLAMIHPADRERWVSESARVLVTREPFSLEYRVITRDGRTVWLQDEAQIEDDELGVPKFWRGVISDVTERKRVEEALAESEERYRRLTEFSPDAVLVQRDGVFVFANTAAARLLGASEPGDLIGLPIMSVVHPDYQEVVAERIKLRIERGLNAPLLEEKFVRRDGGVVDVEVAAIGLTYDGGPASLIVVRDITERLRTEGQLRRAEAKYRALVEQMPAIVYMAEFEEGGTWLYVSPQIEPILGYTPEEWTNNPSLFDERIHPDDEPAYRTDEAASRISGSPLSTTYRMIARDGHEVWFRDEAVVVRDENGSPLFHQGIMFDVTQGKLAEAALRDGLQREQEAAEQLRKLDEMRNAFLHAVSHELRTPLTSVMGFALTLGRKDLTISDEDREDMLNRLAANARKLERLLSDLLDVDRLARGILEPKLYPTDLGDLCRRVVSETDVGDRTVHVEGEVKATIDGAKVERILENLLVNAARHTPEGSTVWIRAVAEEDGVRLIVEDDGPGVPDELKQQVFEPFARAGTTREHSPGAGIGLSLVARFAELHGGRAWVEDRDGGGSSFRVFLPAAPQTHAELASDQDPAGESSEEPTELGVA